MEEVITLEDETRLAFQAAAERRGIHLSVSAKDELAERIAYVRLNAKPQLGRFRSIASEGDFRPTKKFALVLAERLRLLMRVSTEQPLFDLPLLLARTFSIFTVSVHHGGISGGCSITRGIPILVVSKATAVDGLFKCAHQLAHIVTLSNQNETASLDPSHEELGTAKSPYEHFADNVALHLLIPERGLGIALRQTRKLLRGQGPLGDVELLYVSRIFGVSFLAVAKRCEQTKLLPKGGALALDRFLTEKFGSAERRAEDLDLPARPSANFSLTSIIEASREVKKIQPRRPGTTVRTRTER